MHLTAFIHRATKILHIHRYRSWYYPILLTDFLNFLQFMASSLQNLFNTQHVIYSIVNCCTRLHCDESSVANGTCRQIDGQT